MDKNSVDFKIIEEMHQGSKITVVFEDDTKVTGEVTEKLYIDNAYDEEEDYCLFRIKFGGNCTMPIDTREIKSIERCVTVDAGLITGRAVIEKYGIPCNRYFGNVITEVIDKWDELDDTAKEEINKVFSGSMNWVVIRDMLKATHTIKQYSHEQHEKIIELLEKETKQVRNIKEFFDKYAEIKTCMTTEASKMLDMIVLDYCGLKEALK